MPIDKEKPIRAVIFDHDGTLVNSEPVHLAHWQELLTPYQAQLSAEEYQQHLSGRPSLASAQWLIERFTLAIDPTTLFQQKHQALCSWLAQQAFPMMDGVQGLLKELQNAGTPMALASGASISEVSSSLEHHQLHQYFPVVATREDVTNNKPAPDVYLLAAHQLGIAPEHCLAIEDSDSGQRAAQAAGMACLRLATPSELSDDFQCHTLPDFTHIRDWLAARGLLTPALQ